MITLTVYRRIQSANAFTNQRGIGKSLAYRRDRDTWAVLLRAVLRPRPKPDKCHVVVEVHSFRNRELDDANLRGGCKGLIDMLVRMGFLYDDAPRYFLGEYAQHLVPRAEEKTVLKIHPPTALVDTTTTKGKPCRSRSNTQSATASPSSPQARPA